MENYKEKYEQAMFRMNKWVEGSEITDPKEVAEFVFPELRESEDERIRKTLINFFSKGAEYDSSTNCIKDRKIIAWLKKQGGITELSEEEQNKFAKGVLTGCAMSFINYLDAHTYEDKMCVSNGECEDIENAFHNAMWDRLHRYYCKYIEKQGEQKQNIIDIISDLENYFATTTKEQQEKDWDEIKNWEEKHFNHDRHIGIKPTDKVEPKFKVGDTIVEKDPDEYDYPNGEDYGIDSLYHAARILEKTLGDVEGYQSDDGILEHKCAIEAVNRLYKQKPWSEEDEKILKSIIINIENLQFSSDMREKYHHILNTSKNYYQIMVDWLKSLKERYTWKPSDEQMKQLGWVAEQNKDNIIGKKLMSLYQDLKKLMKE